MTVNPAEALTQRQLELLALVASGYDMSQIAAAKFLSVYTVRNTLALARERVGAQNLAHLCALAIDAGIIVKNGNGFKPVVDPYVAE